MENVKFIAVVGLSLCFALPVCAEESVKTLGDLSRVQSETVLFKAQAKREDARADLASKRAGMGGVGDGTLPVVKSVLGNDKMVVVEFLYPGNVKVSATVGNVIPGGYVLKRVDESSYQVELRKGRETFVVGFASGASSAKQQASAGYPLSQPMPIR